jgi:hypothetical protein
VCQQPSIQPVGNAGSSSGCDPGDDGCGTGAILTTNSLGSGLSAADISLTNTGCGYQSAPSCNINLGTSGLTGSSACHLAM